MNRFYYASVAPVIVKNQVIAGVSGDDMDNPGYVEAHDPVTGEMSGAGTRCRRRRAIRVGDLAERGGHEARRRHDVDAGTYDPELNLIYRHDRQSPAGHRAQEPPGRQPVHRLDRRAHGRHREDGLVFPGIPARHSRLGRCPDAGALRRDDRRQAAQARGPGSRNGHFFVLDRTTASPSSRPNSSRRTGRSATTSAASRSPIRRRCRRSTARSCRRIRAAPRTGNRRRSAR